MPLRDHFRPPFNQRIPWDQVHGMWPGEIVIELNKVLPERYAARPLVHRGGRVEFDLGQIDTESDVKIWKPAGPTLAEETNLADFDEYEVRVFDRHDGVRLVAAIELINPSNKESRENRLQFVSKCLALMRKFVAVVIVDVVTTMQVNLYADLLDTMGLTDRSLGAAPAPIYTVAGRWRPRGERYCLDTWNYKLEPGEPLPSVPLWLAENLAVPLHLEASYEQTLIDLRIK